MGSMSFWSTKIVLTVAHIPKQKELWQYSLYGVMQDSYHHRYVTTWGSRRLTLESFELVCFPDSVLLKALGNVILWWLEKTAKYWGGIGSQILYLHGASVAKT